MNYQAIRETAVEFMLDRGWKQKTAKRKGFEQSLFDHTLIEIDVFVTLLPLMRETIKPALTQQEEKILLLSAIAHDVGKEPDEWQEYVLDKSSFISDVNRELAEEVVPQLAERFGCTGTEEILSGVLQHMRGERTPAKNIDRALFGDHANPRWKTLAELVDDVDNLCSIPGLFSTLLYLDQRSCLSKHIQATYHLVQLRGVSTALLHGAAIDAFTEKGWSPLLHYSNGTIYVTSAVSHTPDVTSKDVKRKMSERIEEAMGSEFAQQVVGNPISTMLPKPDLFDCEEVKQYLETAASRVTTRTFGRKKKDEQLGKAAKYLELINVENPGQQEIERQADRIGRAYPEMSIFAFFKAMWKQELLGDPKSELLKETYEDIFGKDTFAKFKKSPAQIQAVNHLELVIDPFWKLKGKQFGLDLEKVEFAPDAIRQQILVDTLTSIARKVYDASPDREYPLRATPREIAEYFINDLTHPASVVGLDELVSQQLKAYAVSKKNARKQRGKHLCPICNQQFDMGVEAIDDFVPSAGSHTNRSVSHSATSGSGIVICGACKFERFLQQLLLGSKVSEMLILFPRMNVGHSSGEVLRRKALQIWDSALIRMSKANPNPDQELSLSDTRNIARKLNTSGYDVFNLTPQEIVDLMTHRITENKLKDYRKALKEGTRQLFELGEQEKLDIAELNDAWATNFATENEALDALMSGGIEDDDAKKIVNEVVEYRQSIRVVCQTPHMIIVPITNPLDDSKSAFQKKLGKDWESETNAGIRELYVTLILGLSLDCSVAVLEKGEVITFEGGEGVARVPPIPALRSLIGSDWVPIHQAKLWFDSIGAASLLANSTAYPKRSNLYSILKSPTTGHVMRRIEQKSDSGQAHSGHLELLETIKEVLH